MDDIVERKIRDIFSKILPRPSLFFDVEVTEHCNLNCVGCGSFAPIAEEEYLDVDEYKKDIERLSNLANGECHHINILGGEPLLHPRIQEIMKITREAFYIGNIILVTNGILLGEIENSFWDACRKNKISIAVTKYPISIDYLEIEKKAKKEEVDFYLFGDHSNGQLWKHICLEPNGNRNEIHSFLHCENANNCTVLEHGRIYPCPRAAKIRHYNKRFGEKISLSDRDSLDIFEIDSLDEIMSFLSKPIPLCRYCNPFKDTETEWRISNKEENEWI